MVDVRRLGPADVALMRQLNAVFDAVFEDPQNYSGAPPSDAYFAQRLAQPHVVALVALDTGRVVGGLVAYELDKLEQARREVYLYDLAVLESHRRRGVASGLIERLREIAAERNAWVVYVQADYGDEPAVAFYTKIGEREDVMHFDIPVAPAKS